MTEQDNGRYPKAPRAAAKMWISMLVCLALWLLLAGPRLHRAASASPEGARRTAALTVLEPIRWLSESTGASDLAAAVEGFTGKDPGDQPGGELRIAEILEDEGFEVPPAYEELPFPNVHRQRPKKSEQRPDPAALRQPSPSRRLRIAVIGDSLADGVGDAIERKLTTRLTHVLTLGRIATGLSRSDYFDWVAATRKVSERYRPDVIVVMVGGNDKQSVVFPGGRIVMSGDPGWGAAYRQRVSQLIEEAKPSNVIWVGLPPVRDRGESRLFVDYNRIYGSEVDNYRKGAFLDIWDTFADKDGRYRAYGRGPGGDPQLLRAGDGEHFTAAGYDLIAIEAVEVMRDWGLPRQALR